MIFSNLVPLVVTLGLALLWLQLNNLAADKGLVSSSLSRKIIHIGTGPIFVLCWLLFKDTASARYLAALVPTLITVRFILIGTGIVKDEAAVTGMSRSGDRREILRGPLFYGIAFVALTIFYWKDAPEGIVALMILCGGDGLADIIGKRFGGKYHLPWSKQKTVAGSGSVFLGGWLLSVFIIWIFTLAQVFNGSIVDYLPFITVASVLATVVESLPFADIDNLTVPLVVLLVAQVML